MATSADVDWRIAAGAVAAAAEVPVAVVVIGVVVGADDPVRPHAAGLLELTDAGRLSLARARELVLAVRRAYGMVLVAAPAGMLVPIGEDGWHLADLTAAVGGSALVVTGPGPDSVNHVALALGALAGHGISGSVITIGVPPAPDPGAAGAGQSAPGAAAADATGAGRADPGAADFTEAGLPVTPIGRIPAERPGGLAGAAAWFHPVLRAAPDPGPDAAALRAQRPPVDGRKVVLALLAVFAVLVLLVCGMAWAGAGGGDTRESLEVVPAPRLSAYIGVVPVPTRTRTRPAASATCPQYAAGVAVTRPDTATIRVNRAWQRIEKWLGVHAPASAQALRPGAPADRIDEVQRRMSVAFPPDLVASLRRHDGATGVSGFELPPFFAPESLTGIVSDWAVKCSVPAADWWQRQFVPFAADGSGGSLIVDQRPGGHGRVGESDPESGTSFERWPASVAELLELTADALETGRPFDGRYRPRVTADGRLDWAIE
ncbi:SMI1/KNR4 family protein [Actinoplanes palleronii]|uniref:Knr4/Smi1-like domain-containing protein n=1 Tax=Actinoplanes palleronii TaxID=113570 RepID=A0ABQ4BPM2_9ACTN|nr:SMI1/KNR4 family protein [Actinoplanes palleronii]GIE72617.1 hypothetical protein Apa02nite_087250 [Actinoplanes palleronii]